MSEEPRIGVYVCQCGLNIAFAVNCAAVAEYTATLPNVVLARDTKYTCSDLTQVQIKNDIKEYQLNRVIVASCSPRLHEPTFRRTCEEAGLNQYLFEMASIREHVSWVHTWLPDEATEKAKDLVRVAVAKARLLEPLETSSVPVTKSALVLGGGVAGMSAALSLARQGRACPSLCQTCPAYCPDRCPESRRIPCSGHWHRKLPGYCPLRRTAEPGRHIGIPPCRFPDGRCSD